MKIFELIAWHLLDPKEETKLEKEDALRQFEYRYRIVSYRTGVALQSFEEEIPEKRIERGPAGRPRRWPQPEMSIDHITLLNRVLSSKSASQIRT